MQRLLAIGLEVPWHAAAVAQDVALLALVDCEVMSDVHQARSQSLCRLKLELVHRHALRRVARCAPLLGITDGAAQAVARGAERLLLLALERLDELRRDRVSHLISLGGSRGKEERRQFPESCLELVQARVDLLKEGLHGGEGRVELTDLVKRYLGDVGAKVGRAKVVVAEAREQVIKRLTKATAR